MNPNDYKTLGEEICGRLAAEIGKLGFALENFPKLPVYDQAGFTTPKDPYSGVESICGVWRNAQGYRVGEITFHGDGSFYAEYDVGMPHPTNHRFFVESITAWGRENVIKAEAKLLPALS